jgi:hypothetical protein
MRVPLAIALVGASLVAVGSSPAQAHAADVVVAHDTQIRYIWPLDGDLLYWRMGKTVPKRAWMARVNGHRRRVHAIPRGAAGGGLGLDAHGRKVFTFATTKRDKHGYLVSAKWFVYYLARDRSRQLSLPVTSCPIDWLSIWQDTAAYTTSCRDPAKNALFLRQASVTRRIELDPGGSGYVFRDGTVTAFFEDGNDNVAVEQYMSHGQACRKSIVPSIGDATLGDGWFPTDLRIVNGYVVWTMGDPILRPDFAILAAKVAPGCDTPGPVGVFPFTPSTKTVQALAVDNGRVFYADGKTLRSHRLPATPSFDPPPNDDFEKAQSLPGDPPLSTEGNTAYATVQAGEPMASAGHTVWYAYRPKTSGTVYVQVYGACPYSPGSEASCGRTYGVYTGASRDALTRLPSSGQPWDSYTRIDAVAGQTYWISVGSTYEQDFEPFTVHVDRHPPPF